jgi:uncharacterized protein (DUF1684 family)
VLDQRTGSLTLLDWRRRVAAMYAEVREATARGDDPAATVDRFRAARDELMRDHPDSPFAPEARADVTALPYWPYDPAWRFEVEVEPLPPPDAPVVATSITGQDFTLERIGRVDLPFGALEVYWINVYGGGVFIPFRDGTSGRETYGAGRYLIDTVKGADLGGTGDRLVLDFNYAYHPSCAYDPRWSCPLAPRANWLTVPIRVGEHLPTAG